LDLDFSKPDHRPNQSPFVVDLSVDLPLILTGVLLGGAPVYMDIDTERDMATLDPRSINSLDRSVIDNWSVSAGRVSDAFLAATVTLPLALNLIDVLGKDADGLTGFGKDALILVETAAVNCIVFNLSKFTIKRPRPYAYNQSLTLDERGDDNASLSFFSGHTSLAFSMATAYSYLYMKRHPDSSLVIPVWLGSHALAASTAYLRVHAGKHFWTDVMVGAVVGSAIGFLVPYLHTPDDDRDGPGRFMATPMYHEGGFGFLATWTF
jgi:membrane-associated phospholipid phosphatase